LDLSWQKINKHATRTFGKLPLSSKNLNKTWPKLD